MRVNKFIALATGISRRAADTAIAEGRVQVNGLYHETGAQISDGDRVTLDGRLLEAPTTTTTILFNKPPGYIVSRDGQGNETIYDLLPVDMFNLKPVGRLDKDSSGLLLLTNDGQLANNLTHPSRQKIKQYEVTLDKALQPLHRQIIGEKGIMLDDGLSKLGLERQKDGDDTQWIVTMHEGRNRQIRRTFSSVGYEVTELHRTRFGEYTLGDLESGTYKTV